MQSAVTHHRASIRTSATHPLQIADVSTPQGGIIGITFCPGKQGPSNSGFQWLRNLETDLDAVAAWGAQAVVTLIEAHEFAMLQVSDLGRQVLSRGLAWYHFPIQDVRPPDQQFESLWANNRDAILTLLRSGGRVLVHCRGGLGRAGTVAARMLIELGVAPQEAVTQVRAARPGAIETSAQLRYVMNLPAGMETRDGLV